jgi:hypothetical protein
MDQIFSIATNVIIFIQYAPSRSPTNPYDALSGQHLTTLFNWFRSTNAVLKLARTSTVEITLRQLLCLRYFQRVRIIHEVALAQKLHLRVNAHEVEL